MAGEFLIPRTEHLEALVANPRDIDALEYEAMVGAPMSVDGLQEMIDQSRNVRTILWDGEVMAIMGVQVETRLADTGAIWFLATKATEDPRYRKAFIRNSRQGLIWATHGFRAVWNAVAVENTVAIRWLGWLGFTFDHDSVQEVRGVPFLPFYKEMR